MSEYRDQVIYQFPKQARVVIRGWFWLFSAVGALLCVVVGLMFLSAARADPMQDLSMDWQALATAQGHVAVDLQAIMQMLQADDARLKWVLDNWIPKTPEPQPAK